MLPDAHHMEQIDVFYRYTATHRSLHTMSLFFFLLAHFPKQNLQDSRLNFKKSPTVYNFLMIPIMIFSLPHVTVCFLAPKIYKNNDFPYKKILPSTFY